MIATSRAHHAARHLSAASAVRAAPAPLSPLAIVARGLHTPSPPQSPSPSPSPSPSYHPTALLYSSPKPQLVLAAARIFALQALSCVGVSGLMLWRVYEKAGTVSEALQQVYTPLAAASGATTPAHLLAGFAVFALLSNSAASAVADRIVTRIEVQRVREEDDGGTEATTSGGNDAAAGGKPPSPSPSRPTASRATASPHLNPVAEASLTALAPLQNPDDVLYITRPNVFAGERTTAHRRSDVSCAPPNTPMTAFRLRPRRARDGALAGGRPKTLFLFPVEPAWSSADLPYLRTLVYGDYFRPTETAPPPDTTLLAIEGFGPYRPAQFADPNSPVFPAPYTLLGDGGGGGDGGASSRPKALAGTPFTVARGTVWANFRLPPKLTLADRRAIERDAKVHGVTALPPHRLPQIGAPTTMLLDGSQRAVGSSSAGAPGEGAQEEPRALEEGDGKEKEKGKEEESVEKEPAKKATASGGGS
jgi:hypothetical protein